LLDLPLVKKDHEGEFVSNFDFQKGKMEKEVNMFANSWEGHFLNVSGAAKNYDE
jgi:hypothetical protein